MKYNLEKVEDIIDGKKVEGYLFQLDFGGVILSKSLVEFQQLIFMAELFRGLSEKKFQKLVELKDKYWLQCVNSECKERETYINRGVKLIICKKHKLVINRIVQVKE